ncbi:hypothetical protein MMC31_005612, partial [Peltigera leucophlebia]|nr:hypothetical protein [Peltigera leucophlebia]
MSATPLKILCVSSSEASSPEIPWPVNVVPPNPSKRMKLTTVPWPVPAPQIPQLNARGSGAARNLAVAYSL